MMASPLHINELTKHYKIKETQLEVEVSDHHLLKLTQSGKFLWRDWVDLLGLSDEQIKDLEVSVARDGARKAHRVLKLWHDNNGFKATYMGLVSTFLEGGNGTLAGEVCKLLNVCECSPLQISFLDELRDQLKVIKTFGPTDLKLANTNHVVSTYVNKFLTTCSSMNGHLLEHLQQLCKRELLISDQVLDMAKKLASSVNNVPKSSLSPGSSQHLFPGERYRSASVTPEKFEPIFSKKVVYHASICCLAIKNCTHYNYSNFFEDETAGHCFQELSISRNDEGRYLVAKQDSTYYIAFQGEPNIAQWSEKYKSINNGISEQCKKFPLMFLLELLRTENNRVVLTGFSFGGLLACTVHGKIWESSHINLDCKRNLVCITFGQPHIVVPGLDDIAEDFPAVIDSIHNIQFERDLTPLLVGLMNLHYKKFEDKCKKIEILSGQGSSQASLTLPADLMKEVVSSTGNLAKAIPALKEPLAYLYHLLYRSEDEGLVMKTLMNKEVSQRSLHRLEDVSDDKLESSIPNHSIEVYSRKIQSGYLNKDPAYKLPTKRYKSLQPQQIQVLKPKVKSVDVINQGSEIHVIIDGSGLWFCCKLTLCSHSIQLNDCVIQRTGACLHTKFKSDDRFKRLKDGDKVKIEFQTLFSSHWPMDTVCHTKQYAMNCRQQQLSNLSPSDVIELSYLNALLEYQPPDNTQPLSERMTAIRTFLEEVVKVVPLESLGYSIANANDYIKQQCAKALETMREPIPSKMMIDAMSIASQRSCSRCSKRVPKEPETGVSETAVPNPSGYCLCSFISYQLKEMGMVGESTKIICGLDLKELYPITRSIPGLNSPINTLQEGRKRLSQSGTSDSYKNAYLLKVVNEIRDQELAVCISLLGSFMDQQEIDIPLSNSGTNQFSLKGQATIGVWALSSLEFTYVQKMIEESPRQELVVKLEDYMKNINSEKEVVDEYAAKLHFIVQGMEKIVTCNTHCVSYSLERQLTELCKKKPDILSGSLEKIIKDWDVIFHQNILSLVAKTHRPMIARWLRWSLMIHGLREELAKYTTIGVVGPVNSGKSTIVNKLFNLYVPTGTLEHKRTTVPFIYNLKREMEGLDVGVVDFPGVDDRDKTISDLTPLLLKLAQIVIFVVSYTVAHTESCKKWMKKLRALNTPVLVCLTHSDKLYAELKGRNQCAPSKDDLDQRFQELVKHIQLPEDQPRRFCSFSQDSDSILNNEEGREVLRAVGISTPQDVGDWIVESFKIKFKQRDVADKLKAFMSLSLEKNSHK